MQTDWNSTTPRVVTSDIPREIEELLINIKYIAALPPGHKYDIGSQNYISASSIPSKVYRTAANWFYTNEDKVGALNFINKTITMAIQLSRKHPKWQQLICHEISLLTDTIANLKHVYSSEPKFVAQLDTIELKIQPSAFNNACLVHEPTPVAVVTPPPSLSSGISSFPTHTPSSLDPVSAPSSSPVSSSPSGSFFVPTHTPEPSAIFFMEQPIPELFRDGKEERIDPPSQPRVKGPNLDGRRAGKKGGAGATSSHDNLSA